MATIEVHLPDEVATEALRAAEKKGLSLDELMLRSLQEKLARDDQFEESARYVLAKNADLYDRLS